MMAMDPRTAEHLENHVTEDSGTEAWNTLNDFFDRKDVFTIGNLRSELERTKLREDDDLEDFINKIETLTRRIRKKEGATALTDLTVIGYVLRGTAEVFQQWIYTQQNATVLADVLTELRSMNDLRKQLKKQMPEEQAFVTGRGAATTKPFFGNFGKDKTHQSPPTTGTPAWRGRTAPARGRGFHARGRGNSRASYKGFNNGDCYNCGKPGHIAKYCKSKPQKEANMQTTQRTKTLSVEPSSAKKSSRNKYNLQTAKSMITSFSG